MEDKKKNGREITPPEVTAKITWVNEDPAANKRASANITIAKCFTIHGLSVMNSSKGLFVAMPTKVKQDHGTNKYYEIAHPVTAEMRQLISECVIGAYQEMVQEQEQKVGQSEAAMPEQTEEGSKESVEATEKSEEDLGEDQTEPMSFVQALA